MSNRNRLIDLPELRSSRSLTSSVTAASNLTRSSQPASFRSTSGPIDTGISRDYTGIRRVPPISAPKLTLSSFSRTRPTKSPDSLPLSRLSLSSDNVREATVSESNQRRTFPSPTAGPSFSAERHVHSRSSLSSNSSDFEQQNSPIKFEKKSALPSSSTYRCLVGLSNLGNTCFMASQLQSLGCLRDIIEYFSENKHAPDINTRSPSKGRLVQAFAALMAKLRCGPDGQVVRPSDVKDALSSICRRFSGYAQQDSQEFLRTLLSGIHDDINEIQKSPPYSEIIEKLEDSDDIVSERWWSNYTERNRSFISGLFCGQLKSQVICKKCSYVSRTFDPFWDLSLQIKSETVTATTLDDCFRIFTAEESISDYYCSRCKAHVIAQRKMSIHRFPVILVIHLKRFEFSSVLPRKLDAMISFPLEGLNLSAYASERLKPTPLYDLKAVSNHYGSTSGGHYTAMGMISPVTWAEFNDSSASRISSSVICSAAAYVLFFRLRNS